MRASDKREYERLPVALEVTHSNGGYIAFARAKNLGYGGMQVELPEGDPGVGVHLGLEFILPLTRARVLADAAVVYKTHGLAGLRFTYVPERMRQSLDDYFSSRLTGSWFW
jgi:hypothetical protein